MSALAYSHKQISANPRFGQIPSHWVDGRLKDVLLAPITDGPHTTPEFVADGVPFLSVDAIQLGELTFESTRFVSESDASEFLSKAAPRRDDLLLGKAASTGKIARVKTDLRFCIWSPLALIRISPKRASPSFVEYVLKSTPVQAQIDDLCTSNTQKNISMADIPRLYVLLPPLDEQRQIAEYLDRETGKIDELIAKQERLVATLTERKFAVVARVFSAIDETTTIPLKYLFSPSRASNEPAMAVLSVYRDYGVIPKSSRADNFNKTPEDLTRYLVVQPGDLVVNKMKAWQGSLGVSEHAGIVSPDYEVARPVSNVLSTRYVHYLLRSQRYVAEYGIRSVGIRPSQWRLYWDQLGDMGVAVPPLDTQNKIVRHVEREEAQIDALSAKAGEMIQLLRERRAALISAAVTGKIDVRGL